MGSHICCRSFFYIFLYFSVIYISFTITCALEQFERTLKDEAKLIIDGAKI